jgi:acyl-coenzyme A thioesterase PaaI-like protein
MVPTHFSHNHSTVGLEFNFKFCRAVKALEPLRLTCSVMGITPKASLGGDLVTLEGRISNLNGEPLLESQGTILITGAL